MRPHPATATHPARRPRRRMRAAACTAAGLVALAALPALASARIVPGRSVAGVSLGDSAARVKAVLGPPESGSNALNYRYLKGRGIGVYFIAGKAFQITVLSPPQATAAGIRVGSTKKAVTRAYPAARCTRAVVGADAFDCRLRARFRHRATETLFHTRKGAVTSIDVQFASA